MNNETKICCICGKEYTGFGNNAWPIKTDGECCDKCNMSIVVPARLQAMARDEEGDN